MSIWLFCDPSLLNGDSVGDDLSNRDTILVATSRADHVRYPFVGVTTVGTEAICVRFTDATECRRFHKDYMAVKHRIAIINDLYENRAFSVVEYHRRLKDQWIEATDRFIQRWGVDLVFPDVRYAIDDVKENLNIPTIQWPGGSFERVTVPSDGNINY